MDIHAQVSRAYTEALARSQQADTSDSCCGPSCCAAAAPETHQAFPEAAASSFGCGNPLAFAGVQPGQTVLDLGSGAGLDLLVAAGKVGPTGRVIGVDMTDAMLAAARANIERSGLPNIEVRRGLIERLPVDDASVDWVISNCVINLSPDKDAVFAEIARVLRPGGQLSISDIVVEALPDWIRQSAAAYAACIGGAIPEAEYLDGLRRAGLSDVQVAERLLYERAQLRDLVASELGAAIPPAALDDGLAAVDGKVASIRVTARR